MPQIRFAEAADLATVAELDAEAFSPYGTAEDPRTFSLRLQAFPAGFVVLVEGAELAGYGCSEKWQALREPGLDEDPLNTHVPDGAILCITGMAVRLKHRGQGYGLMILDYLIAIARAEHCTKIVLETTHAQGLYRKRGFTTWHRRVERGVTLEVMVHDLT